MYLCNDGLPIDKSPLFKGFQYQTSEFENRDSRMEQTFIVPGSEVFSREVSGHLPIRDL